jgi:hypothetical protein
MCYTKVRADGTEHEMWLPVMDGANNAMKSERYEIQTKYKKITVEPATMFDINKTIMRCLTKNLAMFGLGLYLYAGEDLPEDEKKQEVPTVQTTEPNVQIKVETYKQIQAEIHRTGTDINKMCTYYNVNALNEMTEEQAQKALEQLAKKTTKNAGV